MEFRIDRLEERIAPSRALLEKLFVEISQLQVDAQSNVANLLSDAHAAAAVTNGQGQQGAVVEGGSDATVVSENNAGGNQAVVTSDASTPVVILNSTGNGVITTTSGTATVLVNNRSAAPLMTSGNVVGSISDATRSDAAAASAGLINSDLQILNSLFAALARL